MSKLSTHQIRAMIDKVNATIDSHEARPGTARNVAALTRSQARLDSYRAELAEREAAEHAQDAEQETSQAGPDDEPAELGPAHIVTDIATLRAALSPAAPPADPLPTVHTPPPYTPITSQAEAPRRDTESHSDTARRQGHSRKPYPPEATQRRAQANAAMAAKATVRAEMTGEQQRATIRTEPDAELAVRMRDLLRDYTLGTVIDMAWATDRELFNARTAKQRGAA